MLENKYVYDADINQCEDCHDDCNEDYTYCGLCQVMLCLSCIDNHGCVFDESDFDCE